MAHHLPPLPGARRPGRSAGILARRAVLAAAAALLPLRPAPVVAQGERPAPAGRAPGSIVGRVVDDASGQPVEGVALRVDGPESRAGVSGPDGRFTVAGVAPGVYELRVSHIAYAEASRLLNVPEGETVALEVRVVARAIALDSIVVRAAIRNRLMVRDGYYDRKRRSVGGTFMEGDDLAPSGWTSTMLAQAPFVELHSGRSAFDRVVALRYLGRTCVPDLFIDGRPIPGAGGHVDDFVFPEDIEAIEVYHGLDTPPEFILHPRVRPCGAIVIWRKRP